MRPGEETLRRLLAPIDDALSHPHTTEIVINEPGRVGIEQNGSWSWRTIPEFTYQRLDAICILAGRLLSKDFDSAAPIVETTLPDGQRFTAIRPPVTFDGIISITIRKSREQISTIRDDDFESLIDGAKHHVEQINAADAEMRKLYHAQQWEPFFELAVHADKTIAAVGRPFGGKTSFIRRIMQSIPRHQRVVTIEDTDEFRSIPTDNRVSLIYGSAGVDAERLIITSLRMRSDRTAIQELRGSEAYAFLRIQMAGQGGSFTTWHAWTDDLFGPLDVMIKSHPTGRQIPSDKLAELFRNLIDIVVHCRRDASTNLYTAFPVYFRGAERAINHRRSHGKEHKPHHARYGTNRSMGS